MAGQRVVIERHSLTLTNLDKVLYPDAGTTKGEVIAYYAEIAGVLLPHLRQRPITRKRYPEGVGADESSSTVFFAKDLPAGTPAWVRRYPIQHAEGSNEYPVADGAAALVWLAQLAALELHVPQWRFSADGVVGAPDRLVLDLDPGAGVSLAQCAEVACWVRDSLADAGLTAFPVTSGSKGIHLYAGLDGTLTSTDAATVARELALALQAAHPDRVTAVMRRADRDQKVFLDWSQNNAAKTTITPYSLRGRSRPWVAAPRRWDELADPGLRQLELGEVLERLSRDGDLLAQLAGPALGPGARPSTATAPPASPAPDRLAIYRSMRDPARTPEPVPVEPAPPSDGTSFVIHEHHARRMHYDVRLERDGVLVSWAVPKGPPSDPGHNRLAVPTEDHPLAYGAFEGTIPNGQYGAGTVRIWDAGSYELQKWRPDEVIAILHGRPGGGLGGRPVRFALIRTGENWLMHRMDLAADPVDIAAHPRDLPAERSRPPSAPDAPPPPAPMLASPATPTAIGDESGWAFEMKWDGVRAIVRLDHGRARIFSRNGREETRRYPDLLDDLALLPCDEAVLDGEIVVLDDGGAPDFGLLAPRINVDKAADIRAGVRQAPAHLMLFDLLELNRTSLLSRPYRERRELLESLSGAATSRVQIPAAFAGDLASALETSSGLRLEGVVAKRRDSHYQPGRRATTWLKIKHRLTTSVVVAGWRPGQGQREGGIGSLLLAVGQEGRPRYVGRVGTGFTDAALAQAQRMLAPLATEECPVADIPDEDARDARWVRPELVAEVAYSARTSSGRLRHPVWLGWRGDLEPGSLHPE